MRISRRRVEVGLGLRDIPPAVTFFVLARRRRRPLRLEVTRKKAVDFVDLRAEMDLALVLSNCADPLDPRAWPPTDLLLSVSASRAGPVRNDPAHDVAEIVRAFEFTGRLHA